MPHKGLWHVCPLMSLRDRLIFDSDISRVEHKLTIGILFGSCKPGERP